MAESQTGTVGVAWALPTIGATGTGVGTFTPQSYQFAKEAERATIKDGRGQDKVNIWYNHKQRLTLEVVVSAATIAAVPAANIIPKPGAKVTISAGSEDTEIDGTHTGAYYVVSAQKAASNTDATRITMELEQVVDEDLSDPVDAS